MNKIMKQHFASQSRLLRITCLGLVFLAVPIILLFVNPILIFVNFQLRVANGSMIHHLLLQEIQGAKVYFHLFNITNGERFLAGYDEKIKLAEVGPFVYQEYRTNDELEIDWEPGVMRYTPHHRMQFIPEESSGRPEDTHLVLPNMALFSAVQMLSKYPYFIGRLFKVYASGMNMKALTQISASQYLWGNSDPIIKIMNSLIPGLIYFNSSGLLTRFYDPDAKYRLTLGTSDAEKFQVKKVERFRINKTDSHTMLENTFSYTNTYEGMIFPPRMTPDTPISLYRYSVCKSLKLQFTGVQQMEYGADAFMYTISSSVFNDRTMCDSTGWCPGGVMDLSPCYFGFPFAITKGHMLDTEPKLFEKIEGLKPNRSLHDTKFYIDPNVGVTVSATMSVQLSLALGDMSLFRETNRFSDILLPVAHAVIKQPKMREEAISQLRLMYFYGPYILMSVQCACAVVGLSLLVLAAKMLLRSRRVTRSISFDRTVLSNKTSAAPLLD